MRNVAPYLSWSNQKVHVVMCDLDDEVGERWCDRFPVAFVQERDYEGEAIGPLEVCEACFREMLDWRSGLLASGYGESLIFQRLTQVARQVLPSRVSEEAIAELDAVGQRIRELSSDTDKLNRILDWIEENARC